MKKKASDEKASDEKRPGKQLTVRVTDDEEVALFDEVSKAEGFRTVQQWLMQLARRRSEIMRRAFQFGKFEWYGGKPVPEADFDPSWETEVILDEAMDNAVSGTKRHLVDLYDSYKFEVDTEAVATEHFQRARDLLIPYPQMQQEACEAICLRFPGTTAAEQAAKLKAEVRAAVAFRHLENTEGVLNWQITEMLYEGFIVEFPDTEVAKIAQQRIRDKVPLPLVREKINIPSVEARKKERARLLKKFPLDEEKKPARKKSRRKKPAKRKKT